MKPLPMTAAPISLRRVNPLLLHDGPGPATRWSLLDSTDGSTPVDVTQAEMARRDHLDSTRATTPLAVARDAVRLDTTELDLSQVIDEIVVLANAGAR